MIDENEPYGSAQADGEPAETAADLIERLTATETELAETKDRLLRALADTENVRRRADREIQQEKRFAASNFAKDLLNVADNLRRALDSVKAGAPADEFTRTLVDGVAATERELLAAFERHGLKRVEPQPGERFDHNLHQAMFELENTGKPAGSIVQTLQAGYVMHDRLLRPAMVGVAKGDARPPEHQRVDTVA